MLASFSDEVESALANICRLETLEDTVGEISFEDITTMIPLAARVVNFERTGVRSQLAKKTKEHIEAEKNSRGKEGQEMKAARRSLAMQRRKFEARKAIQSMQFGKRLSGGCTNMVLWLLDHFTGHCDDVYSKEQ